MTSILIFLVACLLCAALGWGLSRGLLPAGWERNGPLLAPVFGAAMLALLASFASYAGLRMRSAAPLVVLVGVALAAAAAFAGRRRRWPRARDWKTALLIHGVGLVGASAPLWSIVLYRAWSPYNDAITYLVIADYLMEHSYFTPAVPTSAEPLLTQMSLYQILGLRMGSNFLLAFFTGLFRLRYSFDAYIPVLALGLWLAAGGFYVFCRRALFMSGRASGIAAVLYALHTGIPITNGIWGFVPQTFGLAFMFPLLATHLRTSGGKDTWRRPFVAGLFFSALLLTYTEVVPFALAAIALCFVVRLVKGRLPWHRGVVSGTAPLVVGALLAPVAAWRFLPALARQAGAVVGWDPKLSLFDYLAVLSGYSSMALSPARLADMSGAAVRLAVIAATVTTLYALYAAAHRQRRQVLYMGVVFAVALVWFAVFAINPWSPSEAGHPWSTFKVVTYGFFLFIAVWAIGLNLLWERRGFARAVAGVQLLSFFAFFPIASTVIATKVSSGMQSMTGNPADPIGEYKRLLQLAAEFPAGQPINLLIPAEAARHQQLVVYFLRRPVIGNWSKDEYVAPHLRPEDRRVLFDPAYPALVYAPVREGADASDPRIANLVVRRGIDQVVAELSDGWFDLERDGGDWWRWLEAKGWVDLSVSRAGWLTMSGDIASIGQSRRMSVAVEGHPEMERRYDLPEQWFTPFTSARVHFPRGRYRISITADGEVGAVSATDPRRIRLGVRNLQWQVTSEP